MSTQTATTEPELPHPLDQLTAEPPVDLSTDPRRPSLIHP